MKKYQNSRLLKRDLSLLIDKNIQFKDLLQISERVRKTYFKIGKNLFDVYEGENLPDGKEVKIKFYFRR